MGCMKSVPLEERYLERSDLSLEEINLRKFELEKLDAFKTPLGRFIPSFSFNKDKISAKIVKNMFERLFNLRCFNLVNTEFFYHNNDPSQFDSKKIAIAVFLLTYASPHEINGTDYYDKTTFIINIVKESAGEKLNSGIEEYNFINLINDFVNVATNGLIEGYLKLKKSGPDESFDYDQNLKRLKDFDNEYVTKLIIDDFYKNIDSDDARIISAVDVNRRFEHDNCFLTAGYIRSFSWKYLEKVKKEEREKQKQK